MPIEEDVYRAFAQLTSTPPRVAALDTLELPLGGRSTDHRAARPKSFAHPRGQSVDDEMSLLDRWLFTHAFAGSVPAGPQYVITEVDEGTAVAVDPEDPVASYTVVPTSPRHRPPMTTPAPKTRRTPQRPCPLRPSCA